MVDRHSRINLLCLLLIVVNRISGSNDRSPASLTESTTDPILFDLLLDPNEANPLSTVSTAPHYTDIYTQLVDRANYWGSLVKAAESPDGSMKKVTWKKAGGVVPWLSDEHFIAAIIDQKYNSLDAPNTVFVLVDDWV